MNTTIHQFYQKLVYGGLVEHMRFLFDDLNLKLTHTKTKCQSTSKNSARDNSVLIIHEQNMHLSEVLGIKEKIGLDN